jgi:hypothetical protein
METEDITQWEYLFVSCDVIERPETEEIPRFVVRLVNRKESEQVEVEEKKYSGLFNTKIEKVKRNPLLEEYLQEQGKQGWEVCSSSSINYSAIHIGLYLILKRPHR